MTAIYNSSNIWYHRYTYRPKEAGRQKRWRIKKSKSLLLLHFKVKEFFDTSVVALTAQTQAVHMLSFMYWPGLQQAFTSGHKFLVYCVLQEIRKVSTRNFKSWHRIRHMTTKVAQKTAWPVENKVNHAKRQYIRNCPNAWNWTSTLEWTQKHYVKS